MKNDAHIAVRAPRELRDKWNKTCQEAGQDSASVARELVHAAIRYYERNRNLYAPFEIVPAARTPEEQITYTVSAEGGVAVNGHGNHVHVSAGKGRKTKQGG